MTTFSYKTANPYDFLPRVLDVLRKSNFALREFSCTRIPICECPRGEILFIVTLDVVSPGAAADNTLQNRITSMPGVSER